MKSPKICILFLIIFLFFFNHAVPSRAPLNIDKSKSLQFINPPFDPSKPTIFAFNGGDCNCSHSMIFDEPVWYEKANFFTVHNCCYPLEIYGDLFVSFLSHVAPDYSQPIQTMGFSSGGSPAILIANYINQTYKDPRYAVNRVSIFDAPCIDFSQETAKFNENPVGGEQAWVDNYYVHAPPVQGALNIYFPKGDHHTPIEWFSRKSHKPETWHEKNIFNQGVTAGAYLSVIGQGKNLQLATNNINYYFQWNSEDQGFMEMNDPLSYPGRLPEPVSLIGPEDGTTVNNSGALLSCKKSENAISYQLLFGIDPRHMNYPVSTTPAPPQETIINFPFSKTYWTIKIQDSYGSTIHADPICIVLDDQQNRPYLNIVSPKSGSVISGIVTVTIKASDKSGVSKVKFYINGILKHTSVQVPFIFNWDTLPWPNTEHILKVKAFNKKGSFTSAWSVVEIRNLVINLQVMRVDERLWLQKNHHGRIDFSVENSANISISKYIILRSVSGKYYENIEEISNSDLTNGTFTFLDKNLDEKKLYRYKVLAIDSAGIKICESTSDSI